MGKCIKNAIKYDRNSYFNEDLDVKMDPATSWKKINDFLGIHKNNTPQNILIKNSNNQQEMVHDPSKMASEFNKYFRTKIDLLRGKTEHPPIIDPAKRLKSWLNREQIVTPEFKLKEINQEAFRKIMRRFKGNRVHGIDWIDSYSLKISAPLIEESLLYLINLSIRSGSFEEVWKPQLI